MSWEIKTKRGLDLENDFYTILSVTEPSVTMTFIDFNYDSTTNEVWGPDVFNKDVFLKEVPIVIKNDVVESIKEHLNLEFTNIIKELSKKSRNKDSFDIDIDKWKESDPSIVFDNHIITRKIVAKIHNCMNYIATNGRIGSGRFIIINDKTFEFLYHIIDEWIFNLNIKFVINKELEDSDLIMGRKNEIDQPGVVLVLDEKSLYDISKDGKTINLKYNFSINGFKPENQYYLINKK